MALLLMLSYSRGMFCQTCGAENANKARFCNMCGIPIAEPGSPGGPLPESSKLEQSSDTIAMPMTPAQAQVIATMSQPIIGTPSITSEPPNGADGAPHEAVTARPSPKNHEAGKTSHGVGLDQPLPDMVEEPPRAAASSPESPSSSESAKSVEPASQPARRKEETWEKRAASAGSPFDTTSSVSLEAIGLPSAKQRMAVLLGGGLLLMGAGALFMYLAMSPSDDEPETKDSVEKVADESRPEMVLGMPVPADEDTPDAGAEGSDDKEPSKGRGVTTKSNADKTSTSKAAAADKSSASRASVGQGSKTAAGSGGTSSQQGTGGGTGRSDSSASNSKTETGSRRTGGTGAATNSGGASESESESNADTPADAPEERNLELEMYSSRVRYAVSRYYAARAQTCFDNITKNEPNLRGTVQIAFKISQDGQVSGSRITKNTTGHSGLGKCLVAQVSSWRLPPPPEPDIELQMPFSR